MTRIVEGTTLGGFRCDAVGCAAKATHSPMICVPYEGFPVSIRNPIIGMVDTHVCARHRKSILISDIVSKPMMDVIEETASQANGRPEFSRSYIKFVRVHSWEYTQFQQRTGLVAPDDALAENHPTLQ